MKIDIAQIIDGSMDDQVVWICDYRHNDLQEKPIRCVPPTEVMIVQNGANPVNYSLSHFRPLKKDGSPSAKVIKPFDNTGYRSYPGVSLHAFDNKEECVMFWNRRCDEVASMIEQEIKAITSRLEQERQQVFAKKVK